jgi:hypothetical protein
MEAEAMTGTTEKTALDLLREGRDLIAKGWMQDAYVAVINGIPCYCAMGALGDVGALEGAADRRHSDHVDATYGVLEREAAARLLAAGFAALNHDCAPVGMPSFHACYVIDRNDEATQASVLAAFDAAIVLASATPAVQA